MEKSVVIPASHVRFLVPGYEQRISEINDQIEKLLDEKQELENVLRQYSGAVDVVVEVIDDTLKSEIGYDPNSSWWTKVRYVLLQSESALTTADVVDRLILIDDRLERAKLIKIVSSTLGTKANSGVLTRSKVKGKDQSFSLAK
jgi:hypothetical protein